MAKSALEKAAREGAISVAGGRCRGVPVKTDKLDKKGKPIIEWQNPRTNADMNCPDDAAGLDIGPATVKAYRRHDRQSQNHIVERSDGDV